jgi:Mg-chelatase subunit ChlD
MNKNPSDNSNDPISIDIELQVRLMNLVLGEASDFERDQLQLLMEQRVEVAAYYQHFEHLHGLLREVGAGDPVLGGDASTEDNAWKLSADRRAKVLAVIDSQNPADPTPSQPDKVTLAKKTVSKHWRMSTVYVATIALTACVLVGLMLPAVQMARRQRWAIGAKMSGGTDDFYHRFDSVPDFAVAEAPSSQMWAAELNSSATSAGLPSDTPAMPALAPESFSYENQDTALGLTFRAIGQANNTGNSQQSTKELLAGPQQMHDSGAVGSGERGDFSGSRRGGQSSSPSMAARDLLDSRDGELASSDDFIAEKSYSFFGKQAETLDLSQNAASFGSAAPAKPGSQWSDHDGDGIANNLSSTVELPKSEVALGESAPIAAKGEVPYTVAAPSVAALGFEPADTRIMPDAETAEITVPEGGKLLLGGIIHTNESHVGNGRHGKPAEANSPDAGGELSASNYSGQIETPSGWTLSIPVTPAVIIPEEEEEFKGYRQVPSPVAAQNAMPSDGSSQVQDRSETDQQVASLADKAREFESDTVRKEEGFLSALNAIDLAAIPSTEPVLTYPDVSTWEELSVRRKERAGVVAKSGKSAAETADFDTLESLVEQTVDSDLSQTTGGIIAPIENPANLFGVTSAPEDKYFEASKDVAPEVGIESKKLGNDDPKPGSPIEQAPENRNGILGDVQVQFTEEIDKANQGGSKGVRRTLEVVDGLQVLSEIDRAKQIIELSDSTSLGKDSTKNSASDMLASEGVTKNAITHGDGQVVDLRELENSERRIKASQVFETDEKKQVVSKGKTVPSPSSGMDAKKTELKAEASKLEKTLADTRQDLSLEQAALRYAVAPSPEAASSWRSQVAIDGKAAAQKQAKAIDEQSAANEPASTFSLHVSDVAFKLAQTALSQGQWPDATKIRIEEFVNALDYHDPLPTGNQKVACRVEQAIHPFLMQRNLLRVSMRTAATGRSQNTPLRLTLLLDNSGSMERPDRRQAVLRAFQTLTQQLSAKDQITLISFASTPRLLADKVPGNQGESLLQLVENLPSEGGTNIEAALLLAREKAAEQQVAGAQNRVVLLTDGAVNLGNANPESLAKLVTGMRDAGIAFDAAGISAQDLNDEVLEALTRQGDGRYYLLDSAESVGASFAAQIAGALRPSAQNVKVQVEFNPQRVGRYKLLGFEKHRLNKEDFRNDKVDAAEMAAAEAGVAVYQFEIKPNGSGDVGSVSVRFRDVSTGKMIENRWPIPYESNSTRLDQAEPSMQLAASAAMFAAKLSGEPLGDSVDLTLLKMLLTEMPEQFTSQPRVQQLRTMIEQAIAIGQ